jgi:RNA polymerase sigma-70 factor (ECF subfamily)
MLSTSSESPATAVDEPADERLVALAQGGDSNAFEQLARRHRDGTYRLALRIVDRPEDAEDVVQEVWLSVFTHLKLFRAESSFQTWLHRIAYNRSLQLRRSQARSALDRADGDFDEGRVTTTVASHRPRTPEDLAILHEERATMGSLMEKLAEKYRRALCLWALDSKSIDQVSREMRISYGAAKTRIHRARLQFLEAAGQSELKSLRTLA